jgi:hypothetical protein
MLEIIIDRRNGVMRRIVMFFNSLSKTKKITYISVLVGIILVLSIGFPTFARFKHRNITDTTVWDGTISDSYHRGQGTLNEPYVISNGSELAYFSNELSKTNYDNVYFELSNDIVLNKGVLNYSNTDGITYILDGVTYYVNQYTDKYYEDKEKTIEKGTLNIFPSINNFKGHFNGNSYRIYGSYITSSTSEELALFTNLGGTITDLYVEINENPISIDNIEW